MYKNAGRSIKGWVKLITGVEMVLTILLGVIIYIIFASYDNGGIGFVFMAFIIGIGCFASWLSGLMLYAFGEIADCVKCMKDAQLGCTPEQIHEQAQATTFAVTEKDSWKCCSCGTVNPEWRAYCTKCSTAKSSSKQKD